MIDSFFGRLFTVILVLVVVGVVADDQYAAAALVVGLMWAGMAFNPRPVPDFSSRHIGEDEAVVAFRLPRETLSTFRQAAFARKLSENELAKEAFESVARRPGAVSGDGHHRPIDPVIDQEFMEHM